MIPQDPQHGSRRVDVDFDTLAVDGQIEWCHDMMPEMREEAEWFNIRLETRHTTAS
jgi:hypothetical protein